MRIVPILMIASSLIVFAKNENSFIDKNGIKVSQGPLQVSVSSGEPHPNRIDCLLDPGSKTAWLPLTDGRFFEEHLIVSNVPNHKIYGIVIGYKNLNYKIINGAYGDLFQNRADIVKRTSLGSGSSGMMREKVFFHCNEKGCHPVPDGEVKILIEGKRGSRPEISELSLITSPSGAIYNHVCQKATNPSVQLRGILPQNIIDRPLKISGKIKNVPIKSSRAGILIKSDGKFECKIEQGTKRYRWLGNWLEQKGKIELRGFQEVGDTTSEDNDVESKPFNEVLQIEKSGSGLADVTMRSSTTDLTVSNKQVQ